GASVLLAREATRADRRAGTCPGAPLCKGFLSDVAYLLGNHPMHGDEMSRTAQKPLTTDAIYRRAGGRRRYNKQRAAEQWMRRMIIDYRLRTDPDCGRRGWCADLARELRVSRSTISRDVQAILDRRWWK